MKSLMPSKIAPPFGAYSHGIEVEAKRLVLTSGQLGIAPDGSVASDARRQADQCFANISAILAEAGLGAGDVLRLNAYVTDRGFFADYMAARDAFLKGCEPKPASTLMIVSGFTRAEFLVEVEAIAGAPI